MFDAKRPKLELLDKEFVEKIVDEALTLLERHGVMVENAEAARLLGEAGARVDAGTQRVRLGRKLVEDCLASTPATIVLYDRKGEKAFAVGGDEVHFDPGSAAVTILDHATQEERKASTRDVVDLYKLVETLEHLHFQSTALVAADVPAAVSDAHRLYLGLLLSEKPFVTGTFRVEGFKPMKDCLAAVRGGERELRCKPLAIFDACPSPPLKWSNLTAQSLVDSARAGIPSELIGMGMTGSDLAGHDRRDARPAYCGKPQRPGHLPGRPGRRAGHLRRLALELRHEEGHDADGRDGDHDDRRRLRPDRQVPESAHPRLHGLERCQGQRPPGRIRDGARRGARRAGRRQRRLRPRHARLRELPEPREAGHRRRHLRHGLPPARRHRPAGRARRARACSRGSGRGCPS